MKIAFVTDPPGQNIFGGYTIQRERTREAIEAAGYTVRVVSSPADLDGGDVDVLHFWTNDRDRILAFAEHTAAKVATIVYVARRDRGRCVRELEGEVRYWVGRGRVLAGRAKNALLHRPRREDEESRWRFLLESSDMFLSLAEGEARATREELGARIPHYLVPNGVDPSLREARAEDFVSRHKLQDFVACVGRFEPLKNQLGLIRALAGTDLLLVLIGQRHPHHAKYFDECRAYFGARVVHIPHIPHPELGGAYAAARVCAQPSFYEAVSLAVLEAGLMGTNIVTTDRSYHREYFGDLVRYADPADIQSIRREVTASFGAPRSTALQSRILSRFTWGHTAGCTIQAYRQALSERPQASAFAGVSNQA